MDDEGEEIKREVPIVVKDDADVTSTNENDVENLNTIEIQLEESDIPTNVCFVKVNGKDFFGNNFIRLIHYETLKLSTVTPTLSIQVGSGSELLLLPNKYSNIYFEVTNNGDQPISVVFRCTDERWLLQWMTPHGALLSPKQTVIVTVRIYTPVHAGSGYRDTITLTATGSQSFEKKVILSVDNQRLVDDESPHLWYHFSSDCLNVATTSCEYGTWSIEVMAQDSETGLLQLSSNPPGIYFPNDFTSGTKEQVTGYYSASCCQSQIQLTAIDLSNNRRVLDVNAYSSATLSPGIIAAIVLGILLFLALIVACILILRYRKRRSVSIDLPTYRGPAGSRAAK